MVLLPAVRQEDPPGSAGARGVYVVCKQRRADGKRCNWRGECKWPNGAPVWAYYNN